MRLIGFILFACSLVFGSCKKKDIDTPDTASMAMYNISYGNDPQQLMDVHLPENRSADSTKVMVFIHGESWTSGSKSEFNGYIKTFQKIFPNYAFIAVDYRLFSNDSTLTNGFPTQEQDIQLAIEFIKASALEWKISNKMVLVGMSAGAHLSLLQAYKHNSDHSIKAIAAFSPPTNLAEGYDNFPTSKALIELVTGGTPSDVPQVYFDASPVNFTSTGVPTILFHGGNDTIVPVQQSVLLKESLLSYGKKVQLEIVPAQGHDFSITTYIEKIEKIGAFFKLYNP